MLSELFWGSLVVTISGVILKVLSLTFKSKCTECKVCCFSIKRDVAMEEKEHEADLFYKDKFRSETGPQLENSSV